MKKHANGLDVDEIFDKVNEDTDMKNNVKLMVPVEIHQEDLIDMLSSSIDNDDAPDFIKSLDLSYQDFEVTEKTIIKLLDSMRGEVIACYGKDSEKTALWDSHASAIKKILEDFV